MNHFERIAIFTVIENLENQLKGLKGLIAASANQGETHTHKVTQTLEPHSHELSEQDEAILEKTLEKARQEEIDRMRKHAEAAFQSEWDVTAKGMAALDG